MLDRCRAGCRVRDMKRIVLPLSLLISACFAPGFSGAKETGERPIFSKGAKLELLFTRKAKLNSGLTEGPAVAPDGSVYFTDPHLRLPEAEREYNFAGVFSL